MLCDVAGALVEPVHHGARVDEHVAQRVQHFARRVHRGSFVLRLVLKRLALLQPTVLEASADALHRASAAPRARLFQIWSRAPMKVTP
jgi:hypothetical protein